jgi:hypothetical protein
MIWNIFNPKAIGLASAPSFTESDFVRKGAGTVSDIASIIRNLWSDVRDSYRPELHYMRGPGPKWRAEHQRRTTTSVLSVSCPQYRITPGNLHAVFEPTSGTRDGATPPEGSVERCGEQQLQCGSECRELPLSL